MHALNKDDLVADDLDAYLDTAVGLAEDIEALATTRSTLRKAMQDSPLLDGKAFCEQFENALLSVFNDNTVSG